MRLTARGRKAVTTLIVLTIIALYWIASNTPDMCLTRAGYLNCQHINHINEGA